MLVICNTIFYKGFIRIDSLFGFLNAATEKQNLYAFFTIEVMEHISLLKI